MRLTLLLLPVLMAAQPAAAHVTRLRLDHGEEKLTLFQGETVVREYDVRLGHNPDAPGTPRRPRGTYVLDAMEAASPHALSLRLIAPAGTITLGCIGMNGEALREMAELLPLGVAIDVVA